jgi:hypothetical protein
LARISRPRLSASIRPAMRKCVLAHATRFVNTSCCPLGRRRFLSSSASSAPSQGRFRRGSEERSGEMGSQSESPADCRRWMLGILATLPSGLARSFRAGGARQRRDPGRDGQANHGQANGGA